MNILDGKYIIYRYHEADSAGEGTTFCLFTVKDDALKAVYYPPAVLDPVQLNEKKSLEDIVKILKKQGVNEVYSVFQFGEKFYDIPLDWFDMEMGLEYAEDDPIEDWAEYNPIFEDDFERADLKAQGIEVKFYDVSTQKIT